MSPISIALIVLIVLIILPKAIKIVPEYERGVIFRLGRLIGVWGPGLFLIIPFVDRVIKVDLRVVTTNISSLEAVTKDNVTVKVDAVVYFRVADPEVSVVRVIDHISATSQASQSVLRDLLNQSERNELVNHREVNAKLHQSINNETRTWGVEVTKVEVKDLTFGGSQSYDIELGREAASEDILITDEAVGARDAAEIESLILALRHKDESARRHAAETLGQIGDARAVKPLTRALKDKSFVVQAFAREAIEKIKAKHALK